MCGIVGVLGRNAAADAPLAQRCESMGHRGPDASGEWRSSDGLSALGHRRLSIIDLSSGGAQPMGDPACTVQVVLNGEIYNYRELREELRARGHQFRSSSDTEVLLQAYLEWGTDCVQRLN